MPHKHAPSYELLEENERIAHSKETGVRSSVQNTD